MFRNVLLLAVALLTLFACRPEGREVEDMQITLSADKVIASADGKDQVTFKVITQSGVDVTKDAEIRVDGSLIKGHSFATNEPAKYVVVASYKGIKSEMIEVTFKNPEEFITSVTLTATPQSVVADGVEQIEFTVLSNNGIDVTSKCKIMVNNGPIKGHTFASNQPGVYQVVAIYNGLRSEPIEVEFIDPLELITSITISANLSSAKADGLEVIEFLVFGDNGLDVTNYSKIKVGDVIIEGSKFSTTQAGVYTVIAQYKEMTSEPIQIEFISIPSKNLKLVLSKELMVADGSDRIIFTVYDESGENLTSTTHFYVDGVKQEGHVFRTSDSGTHEVYGVFDEIKTPTVQFSAQTEFRATYKLVVESFTAVWCSFCPNGVLLLEDLAKSEYVVPLSLHPYCKPSDPQYFDPFTIAEHLQLAKVYNLEVVPSMVFSRDVGTLFIPNESYKSAEILKNHLKPNASVGIAVSSSVDKNLVEAVVHVTSPISNPNLKLVVMITEDGLKYDQNNGVRKDLPRILKDFEHNYVVRAFSSSGLYGESITLNAHQPIEKKVSIPIDSKWKIENCDLVVLVCDANNQVINAQKVKVGEHIGY